MRTCTGTVDFDLNVTATAGAIVATMRYASTGSEFHGSAAVSSKAGGPGHVRVDPFTLVATSCVGGTYDSVLAVYNGAVLTSSTPLLGSLNVSISEHCA